MTAGEVYMCQILPCKAPKYGSEAALGGSEGGQPL